ncbi:MAG: hypothetical protein EA343_10390 [Nodularia sp. (in: Bacteria)]|nr:MAG: hypothetical protein EA343_10390 [Nodularia sp. (in: cyanobacteria)]
MTILFNLESYIDACQYALIFKDSFDQLIPESREAYKFLLDKYAEHRYLAAPIINNNRPSQLIINPTQLNYLSVGTKLTQGEKQRLFIISDTLDLMTLSTSNILGRKDSYLYSSAYHYWNHYTEINQYQITKPLIFVDLDSFGISNLIPISFTKAENSSYQIPILDTRNRLNLDQSYDCIEQYAIICDEISQVLLHNFPAFLNNAETVNHLSDYLKKNNFLHLIHSYIKQEVINLIIEIKHNNQIFYKEVILSISDIANILVQKLNFKYLNELANTYSQYQFVLVSKYNMFEQINPQLSNFICLKPSYQEFEGIWTEKNNLNFPLFAIYLDEIEFAVAIDNQQEWIKLSHERDAISYEGKLTILIGSIPNKNQDFVCIPKGRTNATLPIKLNGNDYCINHVPQDYRIEIENYQEKQELEEILVQIQFHLQPGSFPELKVRDLEDKYKIHTEFIDRQNISDSYSYIPPAKITENRQQKSLFQIQRLQKSISFQDFRKHLNKITSILDRINSNPETHNSYNSLIKSIKNAHQDLNQKPDLLQFIDISSKEQVVNELITELKNANIPTIVDIIYNTLIYNQPLNNQKKDFLANAIILTGKLYQFSKNLLSDRLFGQVQFDKASRIKSGNFENEYLQCLARIAVSEKSQDLYFSLFESQYSLEKSQYLWGYGRILLWHYNFNSSDSFLNYQEHFTKILYYLLTKHYKKFSVGYKQNAFLSLIYLLTFRAHDSSFCQPGSEEFLLANKVIKCFQEDRIILNTVSRENSLNQYFQEMIEGSSTVDGIANLLQG